MKKIVKLLIVLGLLACLGGVAVIAVVTYVSYDLPDSTILKNYRPAIPSKILSKDGEILLEVGKEKREIVLFENIPKRVVNSFLAAEDDKFFEHSGVDFKGILRATLINIKAGRVVQGASTITQQVAKSLLLTNERTFTRKIKDILLALKIEENFSKEEILYLYLNQVYLGGGYYGIKAAFAGYFNKSLAEASIAEAALIAGLLVAPGKYSPYINPKYAKTRQRYVLKRLLATGKISEEEYELASNEDIKMYLRKSNRMKAGYFTDWIRQRVIEKLGEDVFLTGGLTIQTTLDWKLQQVAEKEVKEGVIAIDKRQGFKGPIGKVENFEEELNAQKLFVLKDNSSFFTFKKDGEVELELKAQSGEVSDQDSLDMKKEEDEDLKAVPSWLKKFYFEGNDSQSSLNQYVDFDSYYQAIVMKTDNLQRLIYVKFSGGLTGVIPYEYFRWAHKREISEKRNWWQYVKRPSSIVSRGDKVLVKIKNNPRSAWYFIDKDFKEKVKNEKLVAAIKKQKYYILSLEQEPEAQSALLSISPKSGEIISMVGGYSFEKSQFNRAIQSNRQPGSAFKPLIYAAGLESNYLPNTILFDTPSSLGSSDENLDWKPANYDGKFKGEMTYRRALETSRNIPTIKLVQDIGVFTMKSFIDRFKLNLSLPNDLSISLGSFGANLLDIVRLYSVFPSQGKLLKVTSILDVTDSYGKSYIDLFKEEKNEIVPEKMTKQTEVEDDGSDKVEEKKEIDNPFLANLSDTQIYDRRLAAIMNNLMKGIVQNGTGRAAKSISSFIGGKTGTTNNYVDAWFIGYSVNLVTGVWTGFDNNETLGFGETGAKSALPIWMGYMKESIKQYGDYDFPNPRGIINVKLNSETGELASRSDRSTFLEKFVEGFAPNSVQQKDDQSSEESTTEDVIFDDDYYRNQ